MTTTTEADWIEKLGARTPVERVQARRFIRSMRLQMRLTASNLLDPFVLATPDGRTLARIQGQGLHLDVGDDPQHWNDKDAAQATKQWNSRSALKDHVSLVCWREFYEQRINQLQAPV